jgi:septum site-determining protein MinC
MDAASIETATAILDLRSATLSLIAMVLRTTDLDALAAELEQRSSVMPGLFDDEPVAIDLSRVRDAQTPIDFDALLALLRRYRMLPLAARGGNPAQMAAALAAGLVESPESVRAAFESSAPAPLVTERIVEVQLPPQPPLVVDRPLRSGQQVYARDRDLIVLALVSHGAEVIADGHIHVYAPLRGRALAGAGGNVDARIFTTSMEAQLLSIAGFYRTIDEALPADVAGRPAMVRLTGDSLLVEPLSGRP